MESHLAETLSGLGVAHIGHHPSRVAVTWYALGVAVKPLAAPVTLPPVNMVLTAAERERVLFTYRDILHSSHGEVTLSCDTGTLSSQEVCVWTKSGVQ